MCSQASRPASEHVEAGAIVDELVARLIVLPLTRLEDDQGRGAPNPACNPTRTEALPPVWFPLKPPLGNLTSAVAYGTTVGKSGSAAPESRLPHSLSGDNPWIIDGGTHNSNDERHGRPVTDGQTAVR